MQLVQTVTTSTLLGEIDSLASLGRPTRYVDDPEPGARRFDYKFVNLVKPSAICSICHHVMVRAVSMCPGGHLGCEECLTKHYAGVNELGHPNGCIQCRAPQIPTQRHLEMDEYVSEQRVRCVADDCPFTGSLSGLKAHVDTCGAANARKCDLCGATVARYSSSQKHADDECSATRFNCENRYNDADRLDVVLCERVVSGSDRRWHRTLCQFSPENTSPDAVELRNYRIRIGVAVDARGASALVRANEDAALIADALTARDAEREEKEEAWAAEEEARGAEETAKRAESLALSRAKVMEGEVERWKLAQSRTSLELRQALVDLGNERRCRAEETKGLREEVYDLNERVFALEHALTLKTEEAVGWEHSWVEAVSKGRKRVRAADGDDSGSEYSEGSSAESDDALTRTVKKGKKKING